MSHASGFGLVILQEKFLANYFGVKIGSLIAGKEIEKDQSLDRTSRDYYQSMRSQTRNDWFKDRTKQLLELCKIDNLRFLSEEKYTFYNIDVFEYEEHKESTRYEYTVIREKSSVIESIEKLEKWCTENCKQAAEILDCEPEDIFQEINDAFFTLKPYFETRSDEGEGVAFFFCVLKTIKELLKTSIESEMIAIYKNDQMIYD